MSDFCCERIYEAFEDGVITFDRDFPGDPKSLGILGVHKEGDGTVGSDGHDWFKINYCPFCGTRLTPES